MLAIARPREDLQVRKVLADQFRGFHRRLDIVDGEHEDFRILGMRRPQQFQPRSVAVENLIAKAAQKIDLGLTGFERRKGNLLRAQDAADDLAEASEAGDDDFWVQLDRRIERPAVGLACLERHVIKSEQHGT